MNNTDTLTRGDAYKATLDDGREVTAHCPNPGAMLGLADPGMRVWLEPNDDPKKKLKFGWRLVELSGGRITRASLRARLLFRPASGARWYD